MGILSPRRLKFTALFWAPLVLWMATIFVGSSLSAGTVNQAPLPPQDYPLVLALAHIGEFAVMAILCHRLLLAYGPWPPPWIWLAVLALTVLYGAADEFHQSFVPGRVPSLVDLGYDSLGAVIGLTLSETSARLWSTLRR